MNRIRAYVAQSAATQTMHMIMRRQIPVKTGLTARRLQTPYETLTDKHVQVTVNRAQTHLGNALAHRQKKLICRRMTTHTPQFFENRTPLLRHPSGYGIIYLIVFNSNHSC